jgi:pentatricopeptide repeat protein
VFVLSVVFVYCFHTRVQVHSHTLQNDTLVSNGLINMYSKCGKLSTATRIFQNMTKRDVFTWTIMISSLVQLNKSDIAIKDATGKKCGTKCCDFCICA